MIETLKRLLRGTWDKVSGYWKTAHGLADLLFGTVYAAVRKGRTPHLSLMSQINRQMLYTGVEAFWLLGAIALLCGSAIVLGAMFTMPKIGVGEYFGKIMVVAVIGELGPLVTSLVVVGRSGTALATYIGTMRVSREVEALEVMGIDPLQFIVQPAFVGIVGSVVCLNIYFITIAIFGGLAVAWIATGAPSGIFFDRILDALRFKDVFVSLLKSVTFGTIVALLSSYHGLGVQSVRMIPIAAINAVVGSMFFVIAADLVVSFGYYVL